MAHRVFNIGSFLSTILLVATVVLCIAGFIVDSWEHNLSVGGLHVGLGPGFSGDTMSRVVFFNDELNGPYRGSIIGFVDEEGNLYPPLDRRVAWGDSFGFYYRYFRWPDGSVLWTLMISLWYPLIVFMVLPATWLRRKICVKSHARFQFSLCALLILIMGVALFLGATRLDFVSEFDFVIPGAALLGVLVILPGPSTQICLLSRRKDG
jgi:hypothetical protein